MLRRGRLASAAAWTIALGVVAFARYRGAWPAYVDLHRWLAGLGVPQAVRNLDYPLLVLAGVAAASGAARVLAGVRARDALALHRPRPGGLRMAVIAALPMVAGGGVSMLLRDRTSAAASVAVVRGVVEAPLLEELLFRGVLVLLPLAVLGDRPRRFWSLAVLGGLVFGLGHAPWTAAGLMQGWPDVLVAGAGGVWFAWLARAWSSLLVPLVLHAGMNLGWMLAGGAGGAGGGGLIENLLRAATIAVATTWTVVRRRAEGGPATPSAAPGVGAARGPGEDHPDP